MRTFALVAALVILGLAAPAFAQAPSQWSVTEPAVPQGHYLGVDATLGDYHHSRFVGPVIEAGIQLGASPIWLHGMLGEGTASPLFGDDTGPYARGSLGLEVRQCSTGEHLCLLLGGDMGAISATIESAQVRHMIAVPRLGLEIGNHALSLRLAAELPIDLEGPDNTYGLLLDAGVAFRW